MEERYTEGMPLSAPPCALYVHLPWCVRKCPYCDFNSYEADVLPVTRYLEALILDLEAECAFQKPGLIHSIFFGGGTPSLFPGSALAQLLHEIRQRLMLAPGCEITLEANPGASDAASFEACLVAGVNRISIGAQSFDDTQLKTLGRVHGAADIGRAVAAARAAGCDNLNLDIMYGLPQQTPAGLSHDLACAFALAPAQLSLYQLTLEPGTPFAHRPPQLPNETILEQLEERLSEAARHGYQRYEISAYARPGRACLHNLNYWQYGDYIGIGAGAHGKRTTAETIWRTRKPRQPEHYMASAGNAATAAGLRQPVAAADRPFEFMLNALRLVEGFSLALFESRCGLAAATLSKPLARAQELGLITWQDQQVRPTAHGLRFLNDLQSLFLPAAAACHRA